MDKLTWYDEDGRLYCRRGYEVALARLASYEATELMPDEIVKMGMMFEDKESVGNYTLKLKRPFTYEGQTFDELNFDFEGLTGDDALAIEDELQAIGKPTISPTFSGQFLVRMAARACTNTIIDASGHPRRIGDDALRALPIFEFNRVRGKARSFLLASEL